MDREEELKLRAKAAILLNPLALYCPYSPFPKQEEVLKDTRREILLRGGMRSGKTDCLAMIALQYVFDPDYKCLILRKNFSEFTKPGGLIDLFNDWFRRTKDIRESLKIGQPVWKGDTYTWTFPSGAKIAYGHLDSDAALGSYKGSSAQTLIFDEVTEINPEHYSFLSTRLTKKVNSNLPIRIRAATNPSGRFASYVKIYREKFENKDLDNLKEYKFTVFDNPAVDAAEYVKNFDNQDEIARAQHLYGEWCEDPADLVYKLQPNNIIEDLPPANEDSEYEYYLGLDMGWHDSTAPVVMATRKGDPNFYVVYSSKHQQYTITQVADLVQKLDTKFGGFSGMVGDTAGGSKQAIETLRRDFALPFNPAEKGKDKSGDIGLLNDDLADKKLFILRSCTELIDEMNKLKWKDDTQRVEHPKLPNHACDALLYCWRFLRKIRPKNEKPIIKKDTSIEAYYQLKAEQYKARKAREMREYEAEYY